MSTETGGNSIRERIVENFSADDLLFADGYDCAIIGVAGGFDSGRVIYSIPKMVEACMKEAGMSYEESVEWLEFNTFGSYVGDNTPIYLYPVDSEGEEIC